MPRRKSRYPDDLLNHNIIIRVNTETFRKLEKLQKESDCSSIAEVVRKILANRRITYLHRDISMNGPMEELALIRKEIKAIGININQQTHRFHISQSNGERAFHALKTANVYKQLDPKIDRLLEVVSKLAEKWLQRS
ncbi:mobilization protein [Olivibacter sp. SDN3]|uniref:mobilization protein n=1 Tax=Olivibacter sp. SDN3 TaxID=2764720 RepID=UPI00165137C3|nr:mobilization protein [Olivibacter sp. SDN3]QNL49793.1 mobilization protein [Olivibacter sp. SDN3]